MGLFSGGKSSSKSTTTNQITYSDSSKTTSGTIGAAASGNIISGGDVYGYNADDTKKIIDSATSTTAAAMKDAYKNAMSSTDSNLKTSLNASRNMLTDTLQYVDRALADVKSTAGEAMTQVASAYSGANSAILQNQSETAALFSQLKPFALYGTIAAIVYFISKGNLKW